MIDFKNIQIMFGDFVAIENLNLTIEEGEFFTLLGPSGCGKTTTLRSLVGFITPTKGDVYLKNEKITHMPVEKREISMVFQSYALFPTLTVYENVAFGLRVKKMSKAKIHELVMDIAEKVDLNEEQLQKKVSDLSGGQQQRVAIARALVLKPQILVLDEPLSNLDAKLRKQLRNELKSLQKKFGITTIYVTHDQEEALTLSDRIAVFNNGIVEQVGTPEEIYHQSKTPFVCNFIGDINDVTQIINNELSHEDKRFENKTHYIRIEKIQIYKKGETPNVGKETFAVTGEITDKEFYGLYTKFTIKTDTSEIKVIEKDEESFNVQDTVILHMKEKDILSYERGI